MNKVSAFVAAPTAAGDGFFSKTRLAAFQVAALMIGWTAPSPAEAAASAFATGETRLNAQTPLRAPPRPV